MRCLSIPSPDSTAVLDGGDRPLLFVGFQFLHRIPHESDDLTAYWASAVAFQFLHRIPRTTESELMRSGSIPFFQFLHRIPPGTRRLPPPILTFQFLHRIPRGWQLTDARKISNFQFLHRIPHSLRSPNQFEKKWIFQFLHRIPPVQVQSRRE